MKNKYFSINDVRAEIDSSWAFIRSLYDDIAQESKRINCLELICKRMSQWIYPLIDRNTIMDSIELSKFASSLCTTPEEYDSVFRDARKNTD